MLVPKHHLVNPSPTNQRKPNLLGKARPKRLLHTLGTCTVCRMGASEENQDYWNWQQRSHNMRRGCRQRWPTDRFVCSLHCWRWKQQRITGFGHQMQYSPFPQSTSQSGTTKWQGWHHCHWNVFMKKQWQFNWHRCHHDYAESYSGSCTLKITFKTDQICVNILYKHQLKTLVSVGDHQEMAALSVTMNNIYSQKND